jgi:hypothetical protein
MYLTIYSNNIELILFQLIIYVMLFLLFLSSFKILIFRFFFNCFVLFQRTENRELHKSLSIFICLLFNKLLIFIINIFFNIYLF